MGGLFFKQRKELQISEILVIYQRISFVRVLISNVRKLIIFKLLESKKTFEKSINFLN